MADRHSVPFFLRTLVAVVALLGVVAAGYLAREQAAAPKPSPEAAKSSPEATAAVPEVDVALFAVG